MSGKGTKKKGEFLEAFTNGDIGKVMHLAKDVPEHNKITLPLLMSEWKKHKDMSPLRAAILDGNYHISKLLVEDGVSFNDKCKRQLSMLSLALHLQHSAIAELLIESGANVNLIEFDETCPLFHAINRNNSLKTVELILSAGFPVNNIIHRPSKVRAIHAAVFANKEDLVKLLLKHHLDLNVTNSAGETVLNIAVRQNFPNMVKLLVKHGAALENRSAPMCPLFLAIRFDYLKMVETLLDLGANVQEGWDTLEVVPPLHFALNFLNFDIVKLLLDRGADVKAKHISSQETALHVVATYLGTKYKKDTLRPLQVKIAKALIDKGANVNAKAIFGQTPLDGAINSENTQLCKLLLREGATIVGKGWIRGDGILSNRFEYIACISEFKCPELIKLCLERGGNYNYRDKHGLTPYHCALAKHNPEMVKVFWQQGCPYDQPEQQPGKMESMLWYNPDSKDRQILEVQAAFIDAIKNNKLDLVIKSLQNGAEPKGCSMKIPSTLHYIADIGNHEIARLLLEKGVPVNRLNDKGLTPLFIAIQKKHLQCCQILLQFGACYKNHNKLNGKAMNEFIKEHQPIYKLFKRIYKSFRMVKKGDTAIVKVLQKYVKSDGDNMLHILTNCVNCKGLTLVGLALDLGYSEIAKELMAFRVQNNQEFVK